MADGYTNVFGGTTVYPSDVSYLALALIEDVTLQWPLQAQPSGTEDPVLARIVDVTPSAPNLSIFMPDATETGPGQITMFYNAGATNFTVKNNGGGTLLVVAPGLSWALYLRDTSTTNGLWRSFQYGASTAQAQASALAGLGLIAQGSLLSQSQPVVTFTVNYTAGVSDRASAYVWTGAIGTLGLTAASTLGNNWFMSIRNAGTGNLTLAPGGADTINGAASLVLRPGDSATINCDGTSFYTIGLGQNPVFAFDYTSIDLTGLSGTYTLSGSELNRIAYDFVGALAGNIVIIVPATTQQYWVSNDTTGGSFTLSIGTATQVSPINVVRGAHGIYYSNGSDVVNADTAAVATPIGISDGGTGATTASDARINLGGTAVGIGVFTAASAALGRTALGAAASGVNGDITQLTGLTTPLSIAQGGTSAITAAAARAALSAASLGANAFTGIQNVSINTAVSVSAYLQLLPTDYGVGKPEFFITKNGVADAWDLGLYDTATNAGTINIFCATAAFTGIVSATTFSGAATAGPASAAALGYMGAPLNTQNGNYTLVLADEGKMLYHTSGSAHAYTIPPNASVAFPIGTVILIENEVAAGVVTVTRGAAVSLFWRGNSAVSADRALAANGSCAIKKVAADTWSITGVGLT